MYVQDRDDKTIERIEEKDGNVCGEKWEVQQASDKPGNFLQAQARAQKTLESMINKYDDLLHKNWELATRRAACPDREDQGRYRKNQGR